jgi:quercetin dioxygenase-like cupin family protein
VTRVLSFARAARDEPLFRVPAFGLTARVRFGLTADRRLPTVVETSHADGGGPPVHRRAEAETFEIVTGRYLFEVNGERFIARRGDLVSVPGGATRGFINVTGTPARQQVFTHPAFDASAFFSQLSHACRSGAPVLELEEFGRRWGIVYLAPRLRPRDFEIPGGLD